MDFEKLVWLMYVLRDEGLHFWLSSVLGLLAFLLTSIILFAGFSVLPRGHQKKVYMAVVYSILALSLLLGAASAFGAHALLDGLVTAYTRPLGPILELTPNPSGEITPLPGWTYPPLKLEPGAQLWLTPEPTMEP